ncbi:unnamed protein product, partial [Candidula unifasciata]
GQTDGNKSLVRKVSTGFDSGDQFDTELSAIRQEAEHYLTFLDQCGKMFENMHSLKHNTSEVVSRLEDLKKLATDLKQKHQDLNAVSNKVKGLATEHPCMDQVHIENTLLNAVTERCHALENMALEQKNFDNRVGKLRLCLKEQMNAAAYFDSVRLSAREVDQQLDRCKSMLAEIDSHAQEVDQIKLMANRLKQTCNNGGKQELEATVCELTKQYEQLVQRLKQQQDNLWNLASSRRKFESDCHKIDKWCEDTAVLCVRGLSLDFTAEVLEQQYRVFKVSGV